MGVNIYLTDTIDIISIAPDEWGNITKNTNAGIQARIEDVNELIKDKDGKEVMANTFIIIDYDESLTYEDKIILKTKNGVAHPLATKEMVIKKLEKTGGFVASHYEVWL